MYGIQYGVVYLFKELNIPGIPEYVAERNFKQIEFFYQ